MKVDTTLMGTISDEDKAQLARIEWLVNYAIDLEEELEEKRIEISLWQKMYESHQDCGDSAKIAAENAKLKEALKKQAEKHKL